jgi:hypothetical protein
LARPDMNQAETLRLRRIFCGNDQNDDILAGKFLAGNFLNGSRCM